MENLTAEQILEKHKEYIIAWSGEGKQIMIDAMIEFSNIQNAELKQLKLLNLIRYRNETMTEQELKDKFFEECTGYYKSDYSYKHLQRVNVTPDVLFEWIKDNCISKHIAERGSKKRNRK